MKSSRNFYKDKNQKEEQKRALFDMLEEINEEVKKKSQGKKPKS